MNFYHGIHADHVNAILARFGLNLRGWFRIGRNYPDMTRWFIGGEWRGWKDWSFSVHAGPVACEAIGPFWIRMKERL